MRKIIESTFVSLDGVIESPSQWTAGYWDPELKGHALAQLEQYDTFLLGRVTYDQFAASWPTIQGDPYFDRINRMPKLVATRTLSDTTWNARPITGDIVEELR
ncbi:MAG TPA: dihydrofolate reductase family protein, partial [Kofleriaceae bacterium]|nr:dihydrofolate reductase family protein [Kofleriaceae bacterium]